MKVNYATSAGVIKKEAAILSPWLSLIEINKGMYSLTHSESGYSIITIAGQIQEIKKALTKEFLTSPIWKAKTLDPVEVSLLLDEFDIPIREKIHCNRFFPFKISLGRLNLCALPFCWCLVWESNDNEF